MDPLLALMELDSKHEKQHAELVAKHGERFNQVAVRFSLNLAEQAVVTQWLESLLPEIRAKGGCDELGNPNYGVIGGGVTYSFTSTSLGDIITVKETITGKELNVTQALDFFFFG